MAAPIREQYGVFRPTIVPKTATNKAGAGAWPAARLFLRAVPARETSCIMAVKLDC